MALAGVICSAMLAPLASAQTLHDVGVFSDLDSRVQVPLPHQLQHPRLLKDDRHGTLVLYEGDWPLKVYALAGAHDLDVPARLRPADRAELAPWLGGLAKLEGELPGGDLDDDGIPDPLDVSMGGLKTALNADRYDGRYQQISYPNGDVDRAIGVCTDVLIRALRNAGFDLQRAVHEDIVAAPAAYPMVKSANTSIDHRRVKSLLPYFARHFAAHGVKLNDSADPYRPGDILFMDTFPDRPGPEHVGLVASSSAPNGFPYVINNWTNGTRTDHMELLSWVPVTHRFRIPAPGPLPATTTQLLVALADGWDASRAVLTRYQREPGAPWRKLGSPLPAVLGLHGLAWGDGVHGQGAPAGRSGPIKREGDGRSPAGLFSLGTARGTAPSLNSKLPYLQLHDEVCVDDPASVSYNLTVLPSQVTHDYRSAEAMQRADGMYTLTIDVQHNRAPARADHGSCIFVHVVPSLDAQLTGCTGLRKPDLFALARWLRAGALLLALPAAEYRALRDAWGLP